MIRFRKDTPRYWFMSNYYSCEFVMNGIRYKNAEAAFQSHKVPLEERKQFSDMPPATAKHFGRHVAFPANWDETRDDVMRRVVMAKFEQNKDLKQRLLETGTQPICSGRMVIAEVKGRRIMLHWRLRCSRFLETALKSIRT